MSFNPDEFLAKTKPAATQTANGFDPDKFLKKTAPNPYESTDIEQTLAHPFESLVTQITKPGIVRDIGMGVAKVPDLLAGIPYSIAEGAHTASQARNIPEFLKGISEAGTGIASIPIAPGIAAFNAAGQFPGVGRLMETATRPAESVVGNITKDKTANDLAAAADNALMMYLMSGRHGTAEAKDLRARGYDVVPETKPATMGNAQTAPEWLLNRAKTWATERGEKKEAAPYEAAARKWEQSVGPGPKETLRDYRQTLSRAAKFIKAAENEAPLTKIKPQDAPQHIIDALSDQRTKYFNGAMGAQVARHADAPVSTQAVADWIRSQDTPQMRRFHPEVSKLLQDEAAKWDGTAPAGQLFDEVTKMNAKEGPFFDASSEAQTAAKNKSIRKALNVGLLDRARGALIDGLEGRGEQGVSQVRGDYGALTEVIQNLKKAQHRLEKAPPGRARTILRAVRHGGYMGALGHLVGMPSKVSEAIGTGVTASDLLTEKRNPAKVLGEAYTKMGRANVGRPYIPAYESPVVGALPEPAKQVPAQFVDEQQPMTVTTGPTGNELPIEIRALLNPGARTTEPPPDATRMTITTGKTGRELSPEIMGMLGRGPLIPPAPKVVEPEMRIWTGKYGNELPIEPPGGPELPPPPRPRPAEPAFQVMGQHNPLHDELEGKAPAPSEPTKRESPPEAAAPVTETPPKQPEGPAPAAATESIPTEAQQEELLPDFIREQLHKDRSKAPKVPAVMEKRAKELGLRIETPQVDRNGKVHVYQFTTPDMFTFEVKPGESIDAAYKQQLAKNEEGQQWKAKRAGQAAPSGPEIPPKKPAGAMKGNASIAKPKEPWQMTNSEYLAKGVTPLPATHPLQERLNAATEELQKASRALMEAAPDWHRRHLDVETKKTTIGAAMEYEPKSIETALKSTKVPKTVKDAYRTALDAEKDASKAIDEALEHENVIKQALSEGKPVPPEVLKDYPELKKPEKK